MADLKAQLSISADTTGVEAGINKAKRSLADLGVSATTAGKTASDGVQKVGEGSEKAAVKVDRATQNIIGAIQRQTAVLEAGSKGTADYYRAIAQQRGEDLSVLKPYLDQLEEAASRTNRAKAAILDLSKASTSLGATSFSKSLSGVTTSLGATGFGQVSVEVKKVAEESQKAATVASTALATVGVSAKQTAAALRGVPAQFTDIITSLQGGQAPLTVLLQQGGQLKDMFGGIGPAARALGGYIVGLVNPFTIAAAAAGTLALAYYKGSQESSAFARAIILSGNAAGVTAGQLNEMAKRISAVSGTQGEAASALAEFTLAGNVAGESMERFADLALRFEKVGGDAVKESAKKFAELGDEPVTASVKLNKSLNYLTASTYLQIKALQEQGREADAAALAQKAYADAMDGRINGLKASLGVLEQAWLGVKGGAKKAWDAMLDIGREDTLQEKLEKAQRMLADRLERGPINSLTGAAFEKGNAALRENINMLSRKVLLEDNAAQSAKNAADKLNATVKLEERRTALLTDQQKLKQELVKIENERIAAGQSKEDVAALVAAAKEKYGKGDATKARELDKARLELDIERIRSANERLVDSYTNSESIMEAQRAAGLLGDREYYESKREFIRLNSEAKEQELREEIASLQREKLTAKDKVDNEKKIVEATSKLASVREKSTAALVVLGTQESAAAEKLKLSYFTARQAAQDYLDVLEKQQAREIAGLGMGAQRRNMEVGLNQIEERYAAQRRELENQRALLESQKDSGGNSLFDSEAKKRYDQQLGLIKEFQVKAVDSYTGYYATLLQKQADWSIGASEALNNYLDSARNVSKQTEDLFGNAFKGIEDSLTKFVTTGKGSFKDLANSIIADLVRMQIRAAASQVLGSLFGGAGAGGGSVNYINGASGANGLYTVPGQRAIGGPVSANRLYQVNERGPELLQVAGRQYLMTGSQGGQVTPNDKLGAGNQTFNYNIAPGITRSELQSALQLQAKQMNATLEQRLRMAGVS